MRGKDMYVDVYLISKDKQIMITPGKPLTSRVHL